MAKKATMQSTRFSISIARMIEKIGWKTYNKDAVLDSGTKFCPYEDFIDREMIHFSKYDCERSIPNMVDGYKTSLRKIFFSAKKRNLVKKLRWRNFPDIFQSILDTIMVK